MSIQACPDYGGKGLGINQVFTAFFVLIFANVLAVVILLLEQLASELAENYGYQLGFIDAYGRDS